MAPVLPSSLSPHVCILPSPDLQELLEASALPPLQHILQSFSPLPQVTTRTTALVSVPHSSFALRFSDLAEVEEACREPEEQRAVRTLDWMTSRINKRCEKWVQDMEERGERDLVRVSTEDRLRTPWWDELRRCAEGDFVPDRVEGWNHPVAVILAVSTTAPNPLQAITALHARHIQFPPWVDSNILRYVLVVHPASSPFSDEEASALFNAVKKQYGLHSCLLPLALPSPPPAPIPVPALMPRLPPPSGPESPQYHPRQPPPTPATPNNPGGLNYPHTINTLRMDEKDIQQTARFTREFVVMSLIPWMEKCAVEWNESYSSTRRLPSRLFSSTRRLFGSQASSPALGHSTSSSVSSLTGRPIPPLPANGFPGPLSPHRRLAEFATILGDFKLAAAVWESLRKESKGGSDMLPILLSPSPALQLHASNALIAIYPPERELPPQAQLRALLYAVRWEAAIDPRDFLTDSLEGERWLVWAAGNAEEAPAALLLAHAALLSTMRKPAFRRAAFWYVTAANRLEKCGIKPLTIYFLQKARELYQHGPSKELSPSFWESENKPQSKGEEFVDIRSGIEYPLARLLYTTGNVVEAVKMFLDILRGSPYPTLRPSTAHVGANDTNDVLSDDKSFLDDFRVAFAHLQSTHPGVMQKLDLTMPIKFCQSKQCKIRFPDESKFSESEVWERREEEWKAFQKSMGNRQPLVLGRHVCANELFWVDVTLSNPLDAEVNLGNVTLVVERLDNVDDDGFSVGVEIIKEVVLRPNESQLIPISLKCNQPSSLQISAIKFDFLGLLLVSEPLISRGWRLHDTQAQRISPTYAPDIKLKVNISPAFNKLMASFVDEGQLVLKQGEIHEAKLWLWNAGTNIVDEIWIVTGREQELWVGGKQEDTISLSNVEIMRSNNSLRPSMPQKVSLSHPLPPNEGVGISVCLHGEQIGHHELLFFFVYRGPDTAVFHATRLGKGFEVEPLLDVSILVQPSHSREHSFTMNIGATSLSQSSLFHITQISTVSPLWKFRSISSAEVDLAPSQAGRFTFAAEQWLDGEGKKESLDFVSKKLDGVLQGHFLTSSDPPEIDLICSHLLGTAASETKSLHSTSLQTLLHAGRRRYSSEVAARQHPHIPPDSHPHIFPMYNPVDVDVIVFWEIPSQKRKGYIVVRGTKFGAAHAALTDVIAKAENSKVKRSMYAETQREKVEFINGIRTSEWNAEMDPVSVAVQAVDAIEHDFGKGPCHVPLDFLVRNHSPLYDAQVTLRLRPKSQKESGLTPFFASYSGKLTLRATVSPSEFALLHPKVLVSQPGLYSIGGWALESEVLIDHLKRYKYIQEHLPSDEAGIVVRDVRRTST